MIHSVRGPVRRYKLKTFANETLVEVDSIFEEYMQAIKYEKRTEDAWKLVDKKDYDIEPEQFKNYSLKFLFGCVEIKQQITRHPQKRAVFNLEKKRESHYRHSNGIKIRVFKTGVLEFD